MGEISQLEVESVKLIYVYMIQGFTLKYSEQNLQEIPFLVNIGGKY